MKKFKFWEYLIQIFIVVFGVCLGMLLNEWNINRKAQSEQRLALSRILNEINEHEKSLSHIIPYHEKIINVGDSLINTSSESELYKPFLINGAWSQIPHWQGIKIFPLRTSAFEAAKLSNVLSDVDTELLNKISAYYENINLFNKYSEDILAGIFNTNSNTKLLDALFTITLIRGDILGFEKRIVEASNQLKNQLEEKL